MLDPHRLSLLRDVVLHGSLAATAQSLGVSASAVSQQLARLERDAGMPLLERVGRGVRPTPVARRLVEQTERILEGFEAAEALLAAARETPGGTLRMATYGTFASSALPTVSAILGERQPGLELSFQQLDPEAALTALTARHVDLIVVDEYPGFPLPPQSSFVRETVTAERLGLFLPRGFGHVDGAGGSGCADGPGSPGLAALARLPWVFEPETTVAHRWARNLCRAAGFEPRVMFQSPDLHVHLRFVESGLAAAILPAALAARSRVPLVDAGDVLGGELRRNVEVVVRRGTERRPDILACTTAIRESVSDPS